MAAQARSPREVVEFAPNVAETVALKFAQGKLISNQYGERMMYSLTDNRVLFLDMPVAAQIADLGINVREDFTITKRWDGKRDAPPVWEVARIVQAGEQRDGTFAVPRSLAAVSSVPAAPPVPPPPAAAAIRKPVASATLVDEANALVDAYAEVLARGLTRHEGKVKPDEIRSILITAYIQRSRLSSVA